MKYHKYKKQAIQLRQQGFSLGEISKKLSISKSTASTWLKDIKLNTFAQDKIDKKIKQARNKGLEKLKNKRLIINKQIEKEAERTLTKFKTNQNTNKILCVLLYWCEGGKTDSSLHFINSDPDLIKYFLKLFRKSFNIDENKFRISLHLHDYHNEKKQKNFWSKITNIPINQFFKIHKKEHSGKNKRKNYPGCISLRYYDSRVLKEIKFIIKYLIKNMGG